MKKREFTPMNVNQRMFLTKAVAQINLWLAMDTLELEALADQIDNCFDADVMFGVMEENDTAIMKYNLRKLRRNVEIIL